jgi:hypothetical protein
VSESTNGLEEKRIKGVGEKSNGRERLTDEKKIKNPGEKEVDFPCSKTWNEGIYKRRRRRERAAAAGIHAETIRHIYLFLCSSVDKRAGKRELYGGEPTTSALSRDNKQLVIYLDRRPAQPSTSPTRKKKGEEKLYCNPENEATLLVYDVADSLMTANQQQLSTWIDHRYPIFPLFPFIFFFLIRMKDDSTRRRHSRIYW